MTEKGAIRVTVVGATDVGRVREHNEDNLLVADLTTEERAISGQSISCELGERGLLLAVADGMGGAASGELASEMAVESVYQAFAGRGIEAAKTPKEEIPTVLEECLNSANQAIYEKSQAEAEHRGMGTTMTAAFALGDKLTFAQVGDSRAYLMRKGRLVQVTKDQSLISQLIEDGTLTEEEAEKIGGRNIILQALGVEADVTVDTKTIEALDGDVLVLCSDGLSGMVKDEDIERTIADADDIRVACARLVTIANEGGGKDNITVILVRYEGPGLRQPMQPLPAEKQDGDKPSAVPGFAAPDAPVDRKGYLKPAVAGSVAFLVVVLILVFLLGGGGEVTFVFPAAGANARLVPADGGEEVAIPLGPNETKTTLDVSPGSYRLRADLDHYDPADLLIEIGRGASKVEVPLVGRPGTLTLRPGTPRVTVMIERIERKEWEPSYRWSHTFAAGELYELPSVAAGKLRLSVSRAGFRTATVEALLPPEEILEVALPILDPVTGTLEIRCPVSGAEVRVVDAHGDELFKGPVPESGVLEAEIRIGEHHLEISHRLYETEKSDLEIGEGQVEIIEIRQLLPRKGSLVITGTPGAWIRLKMVGQDAGVAQEQIPASGRVIMDDLTPGKYVVELDRGASRPESLPAEVKPAATESVEFDR